MDLSGKMIFIFKSMHFGVCFDVCVMMQALILHQRGRKETKRYGGRSGGKSSNKT